MRRALDWRAGKGLTHTHSSVNLILALAMIPIGKKFDFNDPAVLGTVRVMYVVSNLAILAVYAYIQTVVNKKKG